MSIAIDAKKCRGCGKCEKVCPGTLIGIDENGKAYMKYPKDCWACSSCIKECSFGAIALYLGADMGGMGSKMTVCEQEDKLYWKLDKDDGTSETIIVDKKESNKY